MQNKTKNPNSDEPLFELAQTLAVCDDDRLIYDFLASLFTESEVMEIGNRWALVRLLEQGMSQRAIAKELGLSLCKITRGSKELKKKDSPFGKMINLFKETVQG